MKKFTKLLVLLSFFFLNFLNSGRDEYFEKLLIAIQNNDVVTVKKLLNEVKENETKECFNNLIRSDYNNNPYTDYNQSLLHFACASKSINLDLIKTLIENGVDINARDSYDNTPLHLAIVNPKISIEVINYLIEKGADLKAENDGDLIPLTMLFDDQYEVEEFNIEVVKFLIKKYQDAINRKQDPIVLSKSEKFALFYKVCSNCFFEDTGVIKLLIKSGLAVNKVKKPNEDNFLHGFCSNLRIDSNFNNEIIQALLENGIDINSKGRRENSVFHCVRESFFRDVECLEEGYPYEVYFKVIKYLISKGADIDSVDNNGDTLLHGSCESFNSYPEPYYEMIKFLIEIGANPYIKNKENKIPVDCIEDPNLKEDVQKLINIFYSISKDFENFYKRCEFTDSVIKEVKFSSQVLQARLGSSNLKNKAITILLKKDKEIVETFLKWVYGLFLEEEVIEKKVKPILQELGLDIKVLKSGKKGLLQMLSNLYKDEQSKDFSIKDFSIIVGDKIIKVHKFLLIARSDLFRGMFLTIKESDITTKVKDYSRRSVKTMKALVKFLYTDKLFREDIDEKVLEELEDAVDYYQLNVNSRLNYEIEKMRLILKEEENKEDKN